MENSINTLQDVYEQDFHLAVAYYIIFLAVWVTLCLPTSIIEVIPGFLFGFKYGIIATLLGKTIGSILSILIGRYVIRSTVKYYIFQKFPIVNTFGKAIEKEGFKMVIAIRLAYLPMMVKNYGISVLDVPLYQPILAGIITGIPFSAMWSFIGTKSGSIKEILNDSNGEAKKKLLNELVYENENIHLIAFGGFILFGFAFYIMRSFKKQFQEILNEVDEEDTNIRKKKRKIL